MSVPVQDEPAGRPTLAALRAMRGRILAAHPGVAWTTSAFSARWHATKPARRAMWICLSRPGPGPRSLI